MREESREKEREDPSHPTLFLPLLSLHLEAATGRKEGERGEKREGGGHNLDLEGLEGEKGKHGWQKKKRGGGRLVSLWKGREIEYKGQRGKRERRAARGVLNLTR